VCMYAGITAAAACEWPRAETHFETALRQAESMPCPPAATHVRAWYAEDAARPRRRGPGGTDSGDVCHATLGQGRLEGGGGRETVPRLRM
jgi:hypothetical protein